MNPKKYAVIVKRQGVISEPFVATSVYIERATNTLELEGVQVRGGTGRLVFNMRYVEYYSVVEVQE